MRIISPAHAVDINDAFGSPFQTFGQIASTILSNALIIAGVIMLFLIVFGGLGIIIGAGSGDQQKTAQGRQAITYALIGFLIIFTTYWIIQVVEVITGVDILNPSF